MQNLIEVAVPERDQWSVGGALELSEEFWASTVSGHQQLANDLKKKPGGFHYPKNPSAKYRPRTIIMMPNTVETTDGPYETTDVPYETTVETADGPYESTLDTTDSPYLNHRWSIFGYFGSRGVIGTSAPVNLEVPDPCRAGSSSKRPFEREQTERFRDSLPAVLIRD